MTLNQIVKEVILEEKQKNLKIFYNIDVNIKEKKEPVPELETPPPPEDLTSAPPTPEAPVAEVPAAESTRIKGKMITEENEYIQEVEGELAVPYEEAMNIQTVNDLVEYLANKEHKQEGKKSIVEIVLDKEAKKEDSGKIISPEVQDIILILSGTAGQASVLGDLITKEDQIIIEIKYGNNEKDNIGFKINKLPGTEVASTSIVKDGELLAGKFDPALVNKYILFFRNSIS